MVFIWFLLIVSLLVPGMGWAQASVPGYVDEFRLLAVQQGGRIKPFDTLARESVRYVTGKAEFEKRDPVETLLSWWALGGQGVHSLKVIEFRNKDWKKKLGLELERRHFSLDELEGLAPLQEVREKLHRMKPEDKVPDDLVPAQELLAKMRFLEMLAEGAVWNMVPPPGDLQDTWASLQALEKARTEDPAIGRLQQATTGLRQALASAKGEAEAVTAFAQAVQALGAYPELRDLAREVHYNHFHPFRKAWVLYLFSLVSLFLTASRGSMYWLGMTSAIAGVAFHIYGFYLRCMIGGRAPVTNMYESVIWVGLGAVVFALLFESRYRARSYLMAACAGAVICLLLADQLPAVLDPSIRPLMPVLRSNFWLTIHVLTITLGYAAFLLALGLGHMVLWRYWRPDTQEELGHLNAALYRSLQVGVLLLAAGTMLGGVWANYSWGRFWGWDPKEVWALIALLGYLAILHARFTGWIGQFGIAAWSVLAFQGVLMAWYGVNFVLGAGLHSYGFGTGGVEYVAAFSLAEVAFVALVAWTVRRRAARPDVVG